MTSRHPDCGDPETGEMLRHVHEQATAAQATPVQKQHRVIFSFPTLRLRRAFLNWMSNDGEMNFYGRLNWLQLPAREDFDMFCGEKSVDFDGIHSTESDVLVTAEKHDDEKEKR